MAAVGGIHQRRVTREVGGAAEAGWAQGGERAAGMQGMPLLFRSSSMHTGVQFFFSIKIDADDLCPPPSLDVGSRVGQEHRQAAAPACDMQRASPSAVVRIQRHAGLKHRLY